MMKSAMKEYLQKHGFGALCPRAVLFDMDGVLYDSMPNHAVAWQESMALFGIHMTREQAYATEGQRGTDTIRQMVMEQQHRRIYAKTAQRMYDEKARIFHSMPEPPVMPGVRELMGKIRAQGIGIGVVTGSGQQPLIARLKRDFGEYLDGGCIVTAYDVKRGKPHPEPYLQGLKMAGNLRPWEAIVVENAPLGVEAGVAAGIFTICVNTGHLPVQLFAKKGANLVFDSMESLCAAWDGFGFRKPIVSNNDRWMNKYNQVLAYMDRYGQRPSKHAPKDMRMVNWIKYNRKLANRGQLPEERMELFARLEERFEALKRINQYAYVHSQEGDLFG